MLKKETVLESISEKIELKNVEAFDPKSYFKTREGLYVWSSFDERILSKTKAVKSGTKLDVSSFKLVTSATDAQIESSLPKKHVFKESEVCTIIAELIAKQPKGEKGELLNTGYANLFYTKSFVVDVRWVADYGEWFVHTWDRGRRGWFEDFRVFSPAN